MTAAEARDLSENFSEETLHDDQKDLCIEFIDYYIEQTAKKGLYTYTLTPFYYSGYDKASTLQEWMANNTYRTELKTYYESQGFTVTDSGTSLTFSWSL